MTTETKLHIERLEERNERELALIRAGAIFQLIDRQKQAISDVEIAMILDLSVSLVRRAIASLEADGLIEQTFQGDWLVAF